MSIHYNKSTFSFTSWCISFNPRNGITDEQIQNIINNVTTRCDKYIFVTEGVGERRHLHGQFFLKKGPTRKYNVMRWYLNEELGLDKDEIPVQKRGLKFAYNNDFLVKYMDKDDDTVKILRALPENIDDLKVYYPPPPDPLKLPKKVGDPYYKKLASLWFEHKGTEPPSPTKCFHFLIFLMCHVKCIRVVSDKRKNIQTGIMLYHYLEGSTEYEGSFEGTFNILW